MSFFRIRLGLESEIKYIDWELKLRSKRVGIISMGYSKTRETLYVADEPTLRITIVIEIRQETRP